MESSLTWKDRLTRIAKRWQGAKAAAKATAIPLDRWEAFISGAVQPTVAELVQIMEASDVDGTWLLTGKGHPIRGQLDMQRLRQCLELIQEVEPHASPEERTGMAKTLFASQMARDIEMIPKSS